MEGTAPAAEAQGQQTSGVLVLGKAGRGAELGTRY
jgi:hypothetical protein